MKRRFLYTSPIILLLIVFGFVWISRDSQQPSGSALKLQVQPTTTTAAPQVPVQQPSFDKSKYSYTDPNSLWVIVNKQHPLAPRTFSPADLQPVGNGQRLRAAAATDLGRMFDGAKQNGLTLTAASGYRSYQIQVTVYDNEVKTYGQAKADSQSARPGYSEHQTGLAIDIAGGGCSITDCFGTTAEGKWAAANAYKYGFIIRYTPENSESTGYRAESWHFRYVGAELAAELQAKGNPSLEEFFGVSGGASY